MARSVRLALDVAAHNNSFVPSIDLAVGLARTPDADK
jgi:hypothetical protein